MATGTIPLAAGKPQIILAVTARTNSTSYTEPISDENSYDSRYFSYTSTPNRQWTCLKAGTYTFKYGVQSAFGSSATSRTTSTVRILINGVYGSRTVSSSSSSSTMETGTETVTLAVGDVISINQRNGTGTAAVCYCAFQIVQ